MKKTNKGFTLVELIIVIAVIGVLAAILIPVFSNVIEKANIKSAFSDARNALSIYVADKTTGENGGDVLEDGTIFKVNKAGNTNYYYFYYSANGLHEGSSATGEVHPASAPTLGDEITTNTITNFPSNVTMFEAPTAP